MKDEVFKTPISKQFEFDESVASVFDDMITRSVPFYQISSDLICEILQKTLKNDAKIVDFGCSTGAILLKLAQISPDFKLTGVDNSSSMLKNAQNKALAYGSKIDFINADILSFDFSGVDAVILNYTLQFIRPIKREKFIAKIYANLAPGGVLIMSEKLVVENANLQKNIIEIYENYKISQGYSQFEIAQKRQALENVLIPFKESENTEMLENAGFTTIETVFKWANFATFFAQK